MSTPGVEPDERPRWLTVRTYRVVVVLLVFVGVQFWLLRGGIDWGRWFQRYLLLGALVVAIVPPLNRRFFKLLEFIRHPSGRTRAIAAAVIAAFSSCYLVFTGWHQGRNFQPKWQDELSYIIQFRMFASGRLWYPKHELADFFDTFQVLVEPVYASIYFPGAALWYAPAQFVGLPFWVMAVIATGLSVGLIYLIIGELIDGVAAALAVVMVLGTSGFRKLSLMIGGHPPTLMIALLMTLCYLRWRRQRRPGWALAIGACAGWGAITRPLDALVVALPIGVAMMLDLARAPLRRWLVTGACVVAAAVPLLALQIVFNVGVTGRWNQFPFEVYADRDYPGTSLGFHDYDPARRPVSKLPQKQKFHDEWTVPAIQRHRPENVIGNWLGREATATSEREDGDLARSLADGMPHRLMFVLLPVGLLALTDRRRVAVWAVIPLFVVAFSFYTFFLPHYAITILPAVVLWVLLGARVVETAWPRLRAGLATFLTLAILILSLTEMAEFNRLVIDELFDPVGLRDVRAKLEALPKKPAVVLFRFRPENSGHEEPVYNTDAAWPDDAEVIRAHDLGDRNVEIFRYYAERQPDRAFYLYDRGDDSITYLGTARELAGY